MLINQIVMDVKIDTKEKFHVITVAGPSIPASMTEELGNSFLPFLQNDVKNIVLNLEKVEELGAGVAESLVKLQQTFYEKNASFVICCLREAVEKSLEDQELLDMMNVTPTESEAWDIVQMEEIERELLG